MTAAAADHPAQMRGEILPTDVPGQESPVYRKPLGIITLISPWNSPINLTLRPIADAADAPFGGERNSGIGRFNAEWIIDDTRTHWITIQKTLASLPF